MVTVQPIDSSRLPQVTTLQATVATVQAAQTSDEASAAAVAAKLINYTTAEQDTGLLYTDGTSHVYQKTLTGITGPQANTVSKAHGITGLLRVISCDCFGTDGTNHGPAPFASGITALLIQLNLDGTNLYLTGSAGSDYSGMTFHATIRYLRS